MTVSSRARLRRFWFLVHMWIGVGLFLLLIPISLTGSWLVWRPELDRLEHPGRYAVGSGPAALPVSTYLANAETALAGRAHAAAIRLPFREGDPVIAQALGARGGRGGEEARRETPPEGGMRAEGAGRGGPRGEGERRGGARAQLAVWLDPGSGKVLEVGDARGGLSAFVHDLHGQLFVFGVGRTIVGWLGVLMLGSCLTGLWLWWPKARPLTLGFRWRRGPGVLINLHYLTGFWISIPLAVLALTGALIAFPNFTRSVVSLSAPVSPARFGFGGPPGRGGPPLGHTELTADQAASAAVTAAEGGKVVSLALPSRGPAPPAWRIQVAKPGGPPLNVAVPDSPGAAASVESGPKPAAGDQLIRLNRNIHEGEGSLLWKLIATLAGLAPALLGITGVTVWAKTQLRKTSLRGPNPVSIGD